MIEEFYDEFLRNHGYGKQRTANASTSKEKSKLKALERENQEITRSVEELRAKNLELEKQVEALKVNEKKIDELTKQIELYEHTLETARVDYNNFRKISERENEKYKKFVLKDVLSKLLIHLDDLKRAQEVAQEIEVNDSFKKGLDIIIKNFEKSLKEEGLEIVETEGISFDPAKHEVVSVEIRNDLPENSILEELDRGYYYNKEVLRPAKVTVSKHEDKQSN